MLIREPQAGQEIAWTFLDIFSTEIWILILVTLLVMYLFPKIVFYLHPIKMSQKTRDAFSALSITGVFCMQGMGHSYKSINQYGTTVQNKLPPPMASA